ncbi:MAG: hypothetical protein H6679_04135 [Epsilonproteobacteria bacterium]|nr:hypothetical protein [Campylobacterota bacterium]
MKPYKILSLLFALALGLLCPQAMSKEGKLSKADDVEEAKQAKAAQLKTSKKEKGVEGGAFARLREKVLGTKDEPMDVGAFKLDLGSGIGAATKAGELASEDPLEAQKIKTLQEEQTQEVKPAELVPAAKQFGLGANPLAHGGNVSAMIDTQKAAIANAQTADAKLEELNTLIQNLPGKMDPTALVGTDKVLGIVRAIEEDIAKKAASGTAEEKARLYNLAKMLNDKMPEDTQDPDKLDLKKRLSAIENQFNPEKATQETTVTKKKSKLGTKGKVGIGLVVGGLGIAAATTAAVIAAEEDEGEEIDTSGFFQD